MPHDVQQIIYDKLHVNDRARLFMALPRNARKALHRAPVRKERQLFVLARAIEKKKVRRLTLPMKDFLRTCMSTDPSVACIKDTFPGQVTFAEAREPPPISRIRASIMDETIVDKHDVLGLLTDEIIQAKDYEMKEALYSCTPRVFDFMFKNNESFRNYVLRDDGNLYLSSLMWRGKKEASLFKHIINNASDYYIISEHIIRNLREYATPKDGDKTWCWCYVNLLECVPFDRDLLERIWLHCLENMWMDAVIHVESKLAELDARELL